MLTSPPSLLDLLEKRKQYAELQRKAEIVKNFGLLAYKPHHKQDLFHSAGGYKSRYARTGNRFGKSTMGAAEDCAWALGYRPWYTMEFDVLDQHGNVTRHHNPENPDDAELIHIGLPRRSVKILILVNDWDKADEIFTNQIDGEGKGKLFKLLPTSEIVKILKNQSGRISEIHVQSKWGGVSAIHIDTIRSWKSNPMGQESSNWDAIHVDEPCPEDMYKANARGLMDTEGSEWFTCTPITEMWINDKFLPGGSFRDKQDGGFVYRKQIGEELVESWMITGSTHDNAAISSKAKATYIASLSDEERETRIDGRPAQLTGAIYKEFKPEIHIPSKLMKHWSDWDNPPADYTIRFAADTHPSTPHAVLFAATAPSGHTFFYSEIFEKIFVKDLCARILERLKGRVPCRALLEQAAYNDTPFDGITIADEFYNANLPVERATKDLSFGILKVQQELSKRDDYGRPFLNFSPHLHETIREFDRYCWNPSTGKPIDKDDHMMENLYRLVLTGLEYVEPEAHTVRVVQRMNLSEPDLHLPKSLTQFLPGHSLPKLNTFARRYRKGDGRYSLRH